MKNILLFFPLSAILFCLNSCDTREDVFLNEKQNPVLNYQSTSNVEVFEYIKLKNMPYHINISVADIDKVDFTITGGNSYYAIDVAGNNACNQILNIAPGNYTVTFNSDSVGISTFKMTCTDRYGKIDTLKLTLNTFFNWPPDASFTLTSQMGGYPFEYTFNSSASVDEDQQYGGGITRYIYTIDGESLNDSINVPLQIFNYVFPQAGNYNIKHWTMDNDSALSDPFIQSVTIN